jgi:hypothetical protein
MDRNGRIRKYHPGVMSEQALEDVIGPLLAEPSVPSGTGL